MVSEPGTEANPVADATTTNSRVRHGQLRQPRDPLPSQTAACFSHDVIAQWTTAFCMAHRAAAARVDTRILV